MSLLNHEVATRLTDHLRNKTTDTAETDLRVPISHYVDAEHAAAERDLFKRLPLIAGRGSEIPQPGNFVTREVMGIPLIIIRRSDGTVASYINMCRHRGGRVENAESGTRRIFSCRYHGWSYGRDCGELRNVPYSEFFESIEPADNGLRTVRTEERHGFLWVDFSNNEERTVADYLGADVEEALGALDLDRAVIHIDETFTLDINWKLIIDGATDMLHPKFLHPKGVGKLIETNAYVWEALGRHGRLFAARTKLQEQLDAGMDAEASWKYIGGNLLVYPNSLVITAPDHVEFWTVWPSVESPTRSTIHIRFLIRPEILDDERTLRRVDKSWEVLKQAALEEDFPMEQTIQDNALACPDGSFVYGRNEQPNQHLHRQLERDLAVDGR